MTETPDYVRCSFRALQDARDEAKDKVIKLEQALETFGAMYGLDPLVLVETPRTTMFTRPKRTQND